MTGPTIKTVFDTLDKWRHLPNYQLERRSDTFFAMFLTDVLEKHFATPINPILIPEFPYNKASTRNTSPKVDFFALSVNCERAFFIELKTDMSSRDEKQDEGLAKAAQRCLRSILTDIKSMVKHKDKATRQKYFHLLQRLENLKLIEMPPGLCKVMFEPNSRDIHKLIGHITIIDQDLKPEVIYVQPKYAAKNHRKHAEYIYFAEFASVVEGRGDIGKRFARSLKCWAKVEAGSKKPR